MGDVLPTCTKCGETRPRSAFPNSKHDPPRPCQPCKPCRNETRRKWYARNAQSALAINQGWRERNPHLMRLGQRRAELRRRYGLTLEDYASILERQGAFVRFVGAHNDQNTWR